MVLSGLCVSQVNVLVCAEVLCDWYAVEVLARLAVVDRGHVEQEQQADEQEQHGAKADPYQHDLEKRIIIVIIS